MEQEVIRVDDVEAAIGKLKDSRFFGTLEIPLPKGVDQIVDVILDLQQGDIHGRAVKAVVREDTTVVATIR